MHRVKHRLRFQHTAKWTPTRVRQLQEYAKECTTDGAVNWSQVADRLGGGVLPAGCEKRYRAVEAKAQGVQRWTGDEVARLRDAVGKLQAAGALQWSAVARLVGTKSEAQCYSKAYHSLGGEFEGAFAGSRR
ncbi:hypothetical protein GQ54DRAFT_126668 [Martensiomyces pterosporus]|nr:hypothetical protein GQ54DRAFT_126668 [Martensiomyces pterosporus]